MKDNTFSPMQSGSEKGFTLFEIIMVIIILGILASVMVPRFTNFTADAHKATIITFVANLKTTLENYASEQILAIGEKRYPAAGTVTDYSTFFDKPPKDWVLAAVNSDNVDMIYVGDQVSYPEGVRLRYNCDGVRRYTLTLMNPAYGWEAEHRF